MTKISVRISLLVLCVTLIFGCADRERAADKSTKPKTSNLKAFYFPVDELEDSTVYRYKPQNPDNPDLFWVLSSEKVSGNKQLTTKSFIIDSSGKVTFIESIKEQFTRNGAEVIDYAEIENVSESEVHEKNAKLLQKDVFLWGKRANYPAVWKYEMEGVKNPGYTETMTRKRYLTDEVVEYDLNDESWSAVVFKDSFDLHVVNPDENFDKVFSHHGKSIYAEGLGLCEYTRVFPEDSVRYKLVDILSKEEWEELVNTKK